MPPLAWIPLGILWFGVGNEENEFIIFLAVFFPVLINTIAGIRSVDLQMIRAARSLGANESAILFRMKAPDGARTRRIIACCERLKHKRET